MAFVNNLLNVTNGTQAMTSAALDVHIYHALQIDMLLQTLSGGSSPNVSVVLQRQDVNQNWLTVLTLATLTNTTSNSTYAVNVGPGFSNNQGIGQTARVQVVVAGAPTGLNYQLSVNADS